GNPPAQGVTGSFGLRISTAIVVRSVRIPFYLDILGFVYGPTEVILQSSGIPVPFPAAAEQHLYTLLLSRAKAQHLGKRPGAGGSSPPPTAGAARAPGAG